MNRFVCAATLALFVSTAYGQMGGLSALAGMRGLGGMGSMGMGLALGAGGGEISAMDYMMLDGAVKQIVGPKASPTPTMLMLTAQQGNQRMTMVQMLGYIAELQNLARQHNVKPPGVTGTPTRQQLNDYITSRAMQWYTSRQAMGQMLDNNNMAGMLAGNMMGSTSTGASSNTGSSNLLNNLMMSQMLDNNAMAGMLAAGNMGSTSTGSSSTGSSSPFNNLMMMRLAGATV